MRVLRVGDTVAPGDVILTTQDGIVQIAPDTDAPVRTAAKREVPGDDIDRVIAELDEGRSDVAPAAGLGGGAGGSLDEGLRVARIGETIDAVGTLPASEPLAVRPTEPTATAVSLAEPAPATPVPLEADSTTISALEQGAPTPLGLAAPTGAGANATLTVTQVPAIGAIQKADGTPVTAGTTLTAAELSGLVYVPPQDYDGSTPVGGFGYTVTSGAQSASGTTSIALGAVNDAPVAQAATTAGDEDAVLPIALRGSDVDGTVAGVTIVSVPSGGTLLLADGVTAVTAGQTLSAAQAGALLFRPAPDLSGSDSIAFTVTDDAGQVSAPAAVLLVVRPVNDAPAAAADVISTPVNTPLSGIAVLANDSDVDGDTLGLASATLADPSQGLLSVNADGTLNFTPAANFSGPVTVHYTVSDASGATASSTLTINVGGNTPPTGTDATLTLAEDTARAFSAGDFGFADADSGHALAAVRIDTLPAAGTLTFNGQPASAGQLIPAAALASLVFTPAPNANGSGYASFTFSVQDSAGGFDAAPNTITLDVTPQPDAAVIGGQDSAATVEDTTLVASGTLSVVDPDAGQQAFVAQSSVAGAHGTFSIDAAGAWTYTLDNTDPAVQALGQGQSLPAESFTVATVDGSTRTVSVSITGVNDAAAVTGVTLGSVTEDGAVQTQGQLDVVDVDGAAAFTAASITGTYGDFAIDAAGRWTYTLRNGDANVQALSSAQHPTESFTVTTADGTTATVTVTVNGANEAPVATVTSASGNEDAASVPVTLAASDSDGAVAGFTITALPSNGTLLFNGTPLNVGDVVPATAGGASLSFVPAANWNGSTSLSFAATDDEGASSGVVSQSITISALNDAPVAGNAAFATSEGAATVTGSVSASDVDAGATLSYALTGAAPAGLVFNADGSYSFDPSDAAYQSLAQGQTLVLTVPYRATDEQGAASDVANLTITITGVNDAAVVSGVALGAVTEDGTVQATGQLTAADLDSAATFGAVTVSGTYGDFAIDAAGRWTYTLRNADANVQALTSAQHPTESFTVTTADGTTATVTVTVNGANEAPVATVTSASGSEDAAGIPVTLAATDVDGTVAAFTVTALPANGTLLFGGSPVVAGDVVPASAGSAALTFVPAANWNGSTSLSFTATDAEGASSPVVTQSLTVIAVNDAPVASSTSITVAEESGGTPLGLAAPSDVDGNPLTITVTGLPTIGTVTLADGTPVASGQVLTAAQLAGLRYDAPADLPAAASTSFTYSVSDGTVSVGAGTTIAVTTVNDAPAAVADIVSTAINTPIAAIPVLANDTDADGDALSIVSAALADPSKGTVTVNADGTLAFTPAANVTGSVVIDYTITDPSGVTSSATVTVNIGSNTPPTGADATLGLPEDGSRAFAPADFGFADADSGQSLVAVRIDALPGAGSLSFNGLPVVPGQVIPAGSLGNLVFTPAPNANGTGYASFDFSVQDSGGAFDAVPNTITLNVTPVADAAAIAGNAAGATREELTPSASGVLTIVDPDAGEAGFQAQSNVAGAHGTFSVDAAGQWTYTLDNADPAVQALADGQSLPAETFTVRSVDGTAQLVTVTITGTNDVAVLTAGSGAVIEDASVDGAGNLTTGGTLTVSDVDAGQAAFQAQAGTAGAYGTFALTSAGAWTYTAANNNSTIQSLGVGQTLTETFTVRSIDGTASTVTVTINGTNDAAVISSGTGSVTEDTAVNGAGNVTTGGTLTVSDADAGQANFQEQAATAGAYGTFTLAANGAWTYTAANNNATIQALGVGQTLTETFTVRSIDGTASTVTVTINGTNDAAVISSGTGSVTEDTAVNGAGNLTTGGTLTVSDADTGQASFQAQAATAGAYGTFALTSAGAWTYTAANNNATIQALGVGQTLTETFTVRSVDGTASTVTVTINGTNDAAVISSGTGSVTEDTAVNGAGDLTTGGTLTVSDVDAGQASFQAQSATAGGYGTFALTSAGAWTYTAANSNPTIQSIGVGQTLTETFTVRSIDGTASTVTVTINGTNDAAVISSGTGSVTEDTAVNGAGNLTTGGTLTVSDVDAGQANFQEQAATAGAYGTFTLAANGAWTYTAANNNATIQALGVGQTLTETFTVRSVDGTPSTVTVTINGTNDAAAISSGTGSVTEDTAVNGAGNLTTGGTLTVSDVDAGQAAFQAQSTTAGAYGTFALTSAGAWTYTAANSNPTIQSLGVGQTLTETFTVRSIDGTASTVTVTINGTNDTAVISSGTGSVTEDTAVNGAGNLTTGGTLTVSDVDAGQVSFQEQAATAGAYGTFTLAANGAWTYTAANNNATIQSLGVGQTLTETFTVRSVDGTASTVTVTINGTNDAAVISSGTGSVTEDTAVNGAGNLTTGGTLTVSDVDAGQASFQAQAATAGAYGTFALTSAGAWTYTAANNNSTIQALGVGQTLTETFTVRSIDGTASTVTVTINGTNDAAVISAGAGSVIEDTAVNSAGNLTTGGTLTISDADAGQAAFQAQAATAGAYGTFALTSAGAWTYTAANNNATIQALGVGQTLTETFTVRSIDGTASTVTVTINGTNDAAVISAGAGSVVEDTAVNGAGNLTTGGTLTVSDVDAGQSSFQAQSATAGAYGTFTLAASGAWTYTAANNNATIQSLGVGQTLTETFTVRSIDGTASTVTVTINGTNDAAVISSGTGSVTEDTAVNVAGNLTTGGTLTVSDADTGQASFQAQAATAGAYGTFALTSAGTWTYTAANNNATIQALGVGQTLTETFTVRSIDGTASTVTVTINGTNDAAVISSGTGSVTEDTAVNGAGDLTTGGTLTVSDVDAGQASFQAQAATAGAYGTFALTSAGAWTYTAANNNATIQSLGVGQTLTETFTVRSVDGTASTVTVTINGTNDAAVISSGTGSVTEDTAVNGAGNLTTGGTLTVSDADTGQASFQAQSATAGAYGTFTLAANGGWTYTAANSNPTIQALGTGQTLTETFTVRSVDGTASTVSVTIHGSNDGPVAVADAGSLQENATLTANAASGVLANDTDSDAGDTRTVSGVAFGATTGSVGAALIGSYGTLTLNADGSYSYVANRPAAESLPAGQVVTEQFSYTVSDAAGASSTATLTFTITGQDDAPTITGPLTGAVREDTTLTATGTLSVADPDAGQSGFVAQSGVAGTYGSFSITAAGVWTYTLNNAAANVQALGATSTLTETFAVATADGTSRDVVVTVMGLNDAPAAVGAAFTVAEDAAVVTGSVAATDADAGATLSYALTGAAPAGLTFNADGSYSFDASNAAYQSLRAGQSTVIAVPFQATDDRGAVSNTANLTITVTGTNDGPVAQADGGSLLENATLVAPALIGVLFNDIDADSGDSKTVSGVAFGNTAGTVGSPLAGTYGTLTLSADGGVVYAANRPAAEALAAGQVVTEQFTYTMHDASGATSSSTITFTITGQNDAPTVTGSFAGTVREDTTLTATGTLTVADPDAGQSGFVAQSGVAGTYGSFSIDAAGVWTYTLNNAAANVQALGATSSLAESFTVATADGTTRTVVVTVNGTNDAPTVVADSRTTSEDNAVSGNVLANDSDIDSASIAVTQFSFGGTTYAAGATGTVAGVGTLTVASNGTYTFTPATHFAGAVPAVGYTVSDGSATSSSTLSLAITPVADAPTLVVNGSSTTGGTTTPPTLPASVGLTVQYFDNIAAVSTSNAGTISAVEAGVESSAATSTSTATDVSVASISVDDAYRFTGYIHLTGGTTYTIGGYRDDTLMVKLGGNSVYGVGFNNWGTLTGTAFTPAVTGYYSIEVIAYNGDGVGSLDLSMAVGNAAAVDLNTTNFRLYPSTASFASSGTVVGGLVANGDGGYYPTSVIGSEDTTIPLGTIAASLNDTDGSESLALRIGSIPVGATLADGTRTFTATAGATSVDVTGWTLNSLTLTPAANVAGDFALDVIATSTDSNGSTAVSQSSLPVRVVATADLPGLGGATTLISMAQGNAATATLNLPVLSTLADRDGSETLSVTIAGVPTGATLNHGSSDGAGTWTVGGADLADLTITLPAGYSTGSSGTTLSITSVATEASNAATASATASLTLVANFTSNTVTGTGGDDTGLNGGGGNSRDFIDGQGGNDTIDARGGDDLVRGGAGDDSIVGANGNDVLFGDADNDALTGGAGTDRIVGGAGNDTLTGGANDGATDVFAWSLADAGPLGTPAVDTITDFNTSAASAGGDVLDLRDLLSGDALGAGNSAGNLANYLDFSVSTSGGVSSTTIHISSSGAFANGNYTAAQEDQTIVLQGVNLPTAMGLASNASDAQIIQELVNRGKLIVDSGG